MSALAGGAAFARLVDAEVTEVLETEVRLRIGRWGRPRRMRLRVSPWWPGGRARALVELVPCGRVVPSTRYFAAGHRYLDELAGGLRPRTGLPAAAAAVS